MGPNRNQALQSSSSALLQIWHDWRKYGRKVHTALDVVEQAVGLMAYIKQFKWSLRERVILVCASKEDRHPHSLYSESCNFHSICQCVEKCYVHLPHNLQCSQQSVCQISQQSISPSQTVAEKKKYIFVYISSQPTLCLSLHYKHYSQTETTLVIFKTSTSGLFALNVTSLI